MSLLKDAILENFTMDPKDYGIPALDRTAAKAAKGDPVTLGFTTYIKQRTQAEENQEATTSVQQFHPDPKVNDTLTMMYQRQTPQDAWNFLYMAVEQKVINAKQFVAAAMLYGSK